MACEQLNARPRLESLDAIRGFDMLWIVGLGGVCCSIGAGRAGRTATPPRARSPSAEQQAYDSKAGRSVVLALGVEHSVPVWARRFDAAGGMDDE